MNTRKQPGSQSIVVRLGIAMGMIAFLALLSIMASTIVAEMSSGKAQAINLAGSLRMQSLAIARQVIVGPQGSGESLDAVQRTCAEFESRLNSSVIRAVIPGDAGNSLHDVYAAVSAEWYEGIKPMARRTALGEMRQAVFLERVDRFVSRIDSLVGLIEQELESKLQILRLVQGVSLFVIVAVITITMYLVHTHVLLPLTNLLECARAVRGGDFAVRAEHTETDELGQLGEAFNYMVRDLSQMYANLEARVTEKTDELARSNQSLELLYSTIRTLSEGYVTNDTLARVLREVERVVGLPAGAICAHETEQAQAFTLAADMAAAGNTPKICSLSNCEQCVGEGSIRICAATGADNGTRIVSVPLADGGRSYGVMPLEIPQGKELAPWQLQLLEAVGRHIGAALATAHRNEERHRLALFEERSVIARELHDSLAQSLSYLKIQVTRLQSMLAKSAPPEQTGDVVVELKNGLNNAYRQLRELLTTFRLRIDGHGLNAALENTVQEFTRRAGVTISVGNRLLGVELASNEEIHVLQVIREALSNIEHHAQAKYVDIALERTGGNRIRVRVDDDGVGIRQAESPMHHYGLVIMRDRARSLNGDIAVTRGKDGGTRVELEFPAASPFHEMPSLAQGSAG